MIQPDIMVVSSQPVGSKLQAVMFNATCNHLITHSAASYHKLRACGYEQLAKSCEPVSTINLVQLSKFKLATFSTYYVQHCSLQIFQEKLLLLSINHPVIQVTSWRIARLSQESSTQIQLLPFNPMLLKHLLVKRSQHPALQKQT